MAQTWNEYELQKQAERSGAFVPTPATSPAPEYPLGTQPIANLAPAVTPLPAPQEPAVESPLVGGYPSEPVDPAAPVAQGFQSGFTNPPETGPENLHFANTTPAWAARQEKTYADQVKANMEAPFSEDYRYLSMGKPLMFDGTDPVEVTSGKSWTNVKDRPLTLAELDPMKVKEKDWDAYLKASVKAMSTATFDAAKDPGVLQMMEQLTSQFYKAKAMDKQKKALIKQHQIVEDDARLLEAQAGLKDEETLLARDRKIEENAKKAKQIQKQINDIKDYYDKNGYSDDERSKADQTIAKLTEQAKALEDSGSLDKDVEQSEAANSLWFQNQALQVRQQHNKLAEDADLIDTEKAHAEESARLSYMKALSAGENQEAMMRQAEAENAYKQAQRMDAQADETARESEAAQKKQAAAVEADLRKREKLSSFAKEISNRWESEAADLEKIISKYEVQPAMGKEKEKVVLIKDQSEATPAQIQEYRNAIAQVGKLKQNAKIASDLYVKKRAEDDPAIAEMLKQFENTQPEPVQTAPTKVFPTFDIK